MAGAEDDRQSGSGQLRRDLAGEDMGIAHLAGSLASRVPVLQ
jgi:hypothetical protein